MSKKVFLIPLMEKSKVLRKYIKFKFSKSNHFKNYSLIKSNTNENDSSNENILLTPDYIEKFDKCNKILKDLEKKCN